MCREISLAQLGPRARAEMQYLTRETGIRVVDGGVYEAPATKVPNPKRVRRKATVVHPEPTIVSLVLVGKFGGKHNGKKRKAKS